MKTMLRVNKFNREVKRVIVVDETEDTITIDVTNVYGTKATETMDKDNGVYDFVEDNL